MVGKDWPGFWSDYYKTWQNCNGRYLWEPDIAQIRYLPLFGTKWPLRLNSSAVSTIVKLRKVLHWGDVLTDKGEFYLECDPSGKRGKAAAAAKTIKTILDRQGANAISSEMKTLLEKPRAITGGISGPSLPESYALYCSKIGGNSRSSKNRLNALKGVSNLLGVGCGSGVKLKDFTVAEYRKLVKKELTRSSEYQEILDITTSKWMVDNVWRDSMIPLWAQVRDFLYKVRYKAICTGSTLVRWGKLKKGTEGTMCYACGALETSHHLLIQCELAQSVWESVSRWLLACHPGLVLKEQEDWGDPLFLVGTPPWEGRVIEKVDQDLLLFLWGEVFYSIWLARNNRKHNFVDYNLESILNMLHRRILGYVSEHALSFQEAVKSSWSQIFARDLTNLSASGVPPLAKQEILFGRDGVGN